MSFKVPRSLAAALVLGLLGAALPAPARALGREETVFGVNGRAYVLDGQALVEESSGRPLQERKAQGRWYQTGTGAARPLLHLAAVQLQRETKVPEDYVFEPLPSSLALRSLQTGQADWALVGRDLLTEERLLGFRSATVAWDALVVVVRDDLPLDDLTVRRLAGIYVGKLHNWAEAGGPRLPIRLVAYSERAGSAGTFRDLVLEKVFGDDGRLPPGTRREDYEAEVLARVASTPGAIGFVPFSLDGIDWPAGLKTLTIDKIEPTASEILAGRYPLARPLNFVTLGDPQGRAQDILDRLLGERVQGALGGLRLVPAE